MISKEEFFSRFENIIPGSEDSQINKSFSEIEIFFEPLSMAGLKEMHQYSKDERLYEFFEYEPFKSIEETRIYVEKLQARMASRGFDKKTAYWFVRKKSDRKLVGTAGLTSLDFGRQSIELGYAIDPKLWGRGYILQIEEILKHYVFEILELNRMHGVTMVTNKRAISSALASGMRNEGILRQYYCKNGVFVDGWCYAMLRSEYQDRKKISHSGNKIISMDEIISIVQSVLNRDIITNASSMETVSSWDSLSHMSIIIAIYEKTGIKLSPRSTMKAHSVENIYKILNEQVEI